MLHCPADSKRWPAAGTASGQRLRRCPDTVPACGRLIHPGIRKALTKSAGNPHFQARFRTYSSSPPGPLCPQPVRSQRKAKGHHQLTFQVNWYCILALLIRVVVGSGRGIRPVLLDQSCLMYQGTYKSIFIFLQLIDTIKILFQYNYRLIYILLCCYRFSICSGTYF